MQVLAFIPALVCLGISGYLMYARHRQLIVSRESYEEGDYAFGRGFREFAYNSLCGAIMFFIFALGAAGVAAACI